ncbi:hypothetical protein F66182_17826, partial [Fusarium sp. NRRL 66182]
MSEVTHITDRLEKPELDDRSYRVIKLGNQLEALLVHDPDTDKASASANVNVGNFSDEEAMPGMAHAVEYPIENAYNQYLAAHSGSSNAYTGAIETNYFFEVAATGESEASEGTNGTTNGTTNGEKSGPSSSTTSLSKDSATTSPLYGALDRFAQFF